MEQSGDFDVFTISAPVTVTVAGGPAVIFNPVTMEVLDNDTVSDERIEFDAGTQFMLVGAFERTDTWLIVVAEGGDFSIQEQTYGLVLRRASYEKLQAAAVSGMEPAEPTIPGKEWEINDDDDVSNMDFELGSADAPHPRQPTYSKHRLDRKF